MHLKNLFDRLPSTELDFAQFNALRTSDSDDPATVQRGRTDAFDFLLDLSRPTSPYYNRALSRQPGSCSAADLSQLPARVVSVELVPSQMTAASAEGLLAGGFRPAYQLCYLVAQPTGLLDVQHDVTRLKPTDADFFFDLLQMSGAAFAPEKRLRKKGYYCTSLFQVFVARAANGDPAAWATMFVNADTAFFGNSFTLPPFRGAGMHSALLAARWNAAAALGLTAAYTDVEHGSQSHCNCERAGFRTLSVNTIWVRSV